jgi:hypothetical protein
VDSLAPKQLRTADDRALAAGDLVNGQISEIIYSSAANSGAGGWLWLGPLANGLRRYVSSEIALPAAGAAITAITHGLGATPSQVRWVLVNKTTDLGYAVADEVPLESTFGGNSGTERSSFWRWANATSIGLRRDSSGTLLIGNKATGVWAGVTSDSYWRLKAYYQP